MRERRVRRGARRVHPDLRALPLPGDTLGARDAHRAGLRAGGERLRVQAQVRRPGGPGGQRHGFDTEVVIGGDVGCV